MAHCEGCSVPRICGGCDCVDRIRAHLKEYLRAGKPRPSVAAVQRIQALTEILDELEGKTERGGYAGYASVLADM